MKLNAYIYSCCGYTEAGAILVFTSTAKEARIVGFGVDPGICEEYIDARAKRLKMTDNLKEQMTSDKPHVIECPKSCPNCDMWWSEYSPSGLCEWCDSMAEIGS